jgi:anti-sigma B factor antagonist
VVTVSGEVDMHTAPQLRDAFDEAVDDLHQAVTADLERVSFIDSSGLNVLAGLSVQLRSAGGGLTLRNVPSSILRTLEIAGLSHLVGIG